MEYDTRNDQSSNGLDISFDFDPSSFLTNIGTVDPNQLEQGLKTPEDH